MRRNKIALDLLQRVHKFTGVVHRNMSGAAEFQTPLPVTSGDIPMYANGTFKNPFTDFDFTKIAGELVRLRLSF